MLQLLNRSYEARFLGCHVLTSAVTSDVLSRAVASIDDDAQCPSKLNDCCTLLCCASGLIVSRRVNVEVGADDVDTNNQQHAHPIILRVSLNDILFCHVDKKRPKVTVWVVRLPNNNVAVDDKSDNATLNVYIYQCEDSSDALALFQIYNEMSRQAKLQRINRRSVTTPTTWNSVTDGIENSHQNGGVIKRRDREIRAAMLEELRETLRTRKGCDVSSSSSEEVTSLNLLKKPLKDVSNMCNNRQRKPAKIITVTPELSVEDNNNKDGQHLIITSPNVASNVTSSKVTFPFPRSMGDIMKRLVNKNRNNVILKSSSLPDINVVVTLPERKVLHKKKKKKAPLPPTDFEPEPVRIPNRINNLTEPYFYLSSKSDNENVVETSTNGGGLVPVLPPAMWVHHKQVVHDIDNVSMTRNVSMNKRLNGGVKKKINNGHQMTRKKFISSATSSPSIFNRSSSTTSNGSSSSESGPDSKLLRSVMKKPKQTTDDTACNESKKNVTFHAYATVQVLP